VLRRIFGQKRDEMTEVWIKLRNEELLVSSLSKIRMLKSRRIRWAGHEADLGPHSSGYTILVGQPEGKRSVGRPRLWWKDNFQMDLRETGWVDLGWIDLAQGRKKLRALVNMVMNLRAQLHMESVNYLVRIFIFITMKRNYSYNRSQIGKTQH
jgi:hypothetical protein